MSSYDLFYTVEEIQSILEILTRINHMNNKIINFVSIGDIPIFDSNGDSLGKAKFEPARAVFVFYPAAVC